jgi:predicted alpha/beta hydrolase
MSYATLKITGYREWDVPNSYFESDPAAARLAVVFPGLHYTAEMPALYYPALVMRARGANVLAVEYDYDRPEFQETAGEEQARWIAADAAAAVRTAAADGNYREITLIGKSLGTIALGSLLVAEPSLEKAHYIWLTPILRDDHIRSWMTSRRHHGLFVIGTADRQYDPSFLAEVVTATGGGSLVLPGADHGLEIAGDIPGSIRAMEKLAQKIDRFIP